MIMINFKLFLLRLQTESFDGRDKPSVLVTSPGSPDFNYQQKIQAPAHSKRPIGRYQGRFSQSSSIDPNIGGRMQIKLGFESSALQLILTIVCAADLTFRPNGAARNPYAKVSCYEWFWRRNILFSKNAFLKFSQTKKFCHENFLT